MEAQVVRGTKCGVYNCVTERDQREREREREKDAGTWEKSKTARCILP